MIIPLTYCFRRAYLKSLSELIRSIHMGRIIPDIEPELEKQLNEDLVHPRKLPTRRNYGFTMLPARLQAVAEDRLQRYSDREFRLESKYLLSVLYKLKLPDDHDTLNLKKAEIKTKLELRGKLEEKDESKPTLFEDDLRKRNQLKNMIQGILTEQRRDWRYYEYDERASLMYMATRLAPNYASLKTVMNEIKLSDPTFKPKSVLDFGSGMGTTIWAVNETWPNETHEFMNVDISKEQQNLCEYLLRGGKDTGGSLEGVFHKQYLPTSNRVRYDMVVSAFSMLELPNRELRAHTIENLWNKTNDLLVFVERGNTGGFETINEARHLILDLSGHDVTKKLNLTSESRPMVGSKNIEAHVLAPCPHEFACPRATMSDKQKYNICKFQVASSPLNIGEKRSSITKEQFSYVILRKRVHPNYTEMGSSTRWPRIVEARKSPGKQVIHKLCCPNGNLAESLITRKRFGKASYQMAKVSDWGDILPIKVKDTYSGPQEKKVC